MSENFRLDRKIGFQNTFYTKCTSVIIDSTGPSIILRSIYQFEGQSPIPWMDLGGRAHAKSQLIFIIWLCCMSN